MARITHNEQKKKWNEEHSNPFALKQMDALKGSSALKPFVEFLEKEGKQNLVGVEMGCGKGRNVIWLAQQSIFQKVFGFDFSEVAIEESEKRAKKEGVFEKAHFDVMDATQPWKYESNFFDFGIDCTASTDIESVEGRKFSISEMYRVLKPGGYLLVYVMSTEDEYHKMIIEQSPAEEANAFLHPKTGKFEKVFSEVELDEMYKDFELIKAMRINKSSDFFEKSYKSFMHWRIYRK
jgi:ubiquinone/menaquinone biosynthesis C-methylase UbiE